MGRNCFELGPFGKRKGIRRKRNKKGGLSGGKNYYNPCLREEISERE